MLVLTLVLVLEVPLLQLLWTCCLSAETRWAFFSLLEAIYGCRLCTLRVPRVCSSSGFRDGSSAFFVTADRDRLLRAEM